MMRLYNILKNKYDLTKSELKDFLNNHDITINGITASLSHIVNDDDILKIDNEIIDINTIYKYYAFYKGRGIECTNNINNKYSIRNFINIKERVFPIGRLDKDSEGLLILTNNQKICDELLNSTNHVEKEYIVKTKETIDETFIINMSKGVKIVKDIITKPCIVKYIDSNTFDIILTEGMNRQIRKMCKTLNRNVVMLKRIRFNKYVLDLKENEIKEIFLKDFK